MAVFIEDPNKSTPKRQVIVETTPRRFAKALLYDSLVHQLASAIKPEEQTSEEWADVLKYAGLYMERIGKLLFPTGRP